MATAAERKWMNTRDEIQEFIRQLACECGVSEDDVVNAIELVGVDEFEVRNCLQLLVVKREFHGD